MRFWTLEGQVYIYRLLISRTGLKESNIHSSGTSVIDVTKPDDNCCENVRLQNISSLDHN